MNEVQFDQKDVITVCKALFYIGADHWDNPNGPYTSTCPLCHAKEYGGGDKSWYSMDEIVHKPECAYLVAKDMLTGIE